MVLRDLEAELGARLVDDCGFVDAGVWFQREARGWWFGESPVDEYQPSDEVRFTVQQLVTEELSAELATFLRARMDRTAEVRGFNVDLGEWTMRWTYSQMVHIVRVYAAREGAD